ncbi:Holliday junction branch migration protein RuvA [candidate division KSB3 bacterium]|uniref:Holliday junction branch migration complex subunit RuvA n=1 Tax=candidate division KSB3 bacterium TaxID=2044937 RepID=A0A2G6E9Q4_9BACT|nr:MAG: Holliday junction branch migration protein RuvA [candidate division KSB3 bacterium]PIE29530.1 MAG: Holliday junction branch migration protein RuvA [candidate division KSB3 bacterium]
MIARLRGQLAVKNPDRIVLDVSGVGYEIFIPISTFYELPESGDLLALHIFTATRENAIELYGFLTMQEKELFKLLLSVSKVGPKLSLAILSGISPDELTMAIATGDVLKLNSIPGIGKKTAERMILELREKVPTAQAADQDLSSLAGGLLDDALSALLNLGYKRAHSEKAVKRAINEAGRDGALEEIIRLSLKYVSA